MKKVNFNLGLENLILCIVRIHTDDMNQIKIEIEKMKKYTTEYAEKGQHIISI